ncbi:glycosyl transferase, family 2 [Candidatus Omnitrophus magneticus]|uniref:Glycosyl transferase, family 2 n=1 Tax=Candidatus Omnitrophus magneticus TaxID=1609969 RepID=A0A0F0CR68_9BACT|nr:glycosyl transferase, family 2 [Candidatus Omnitrophus magneticus]
MSHSKKSLYLRFYNDISSEIASLIDYGCKKILLAGITEENRILLKNVKRCIGNTIDTLRRDELNTLPQKIHAYDVIILCIADDPKTLSLTMLNCIDLEVGIVCAPISNDYYKNRPIFFTSIPKSGTHMLLPFFDATGIVRSKNDIPENGMWSTIAHNKYSYHAPCKEFLMNEWVEQIGQSRCFFSPIIFLYRHPLDIIVSELDWCLRPQISLSHYLRSMSDKNKQLMSLIDDPVIAKNIRDRMNDYIGWLNFLNVIPVSYEEIVGSIGGGDDRLQIKTIWSLLLKLHIPGSPEQIRQHLYNEHSPTFSKGKIGRYKGVFTKDHYNKLRLLPQDFMEVMGYGIGDEYLSKHVEGFRKRPLSIDIVDSSNFSPQLLETTESGFNIVKLGGQYYVVPHGVELITSDVGGFRTFEDAKMAVLTEESRKKVLEETRKKVIEETREILYGRNKDLQLSPVLVESYKCFNIIQYMSGYIAISQIVGDIDLQNIKLSDLDKLTQDRKCYTASSIFSIKFYIDVLTHDMESCHNPMPVESYEGFNIVQYMNYYLGINQAVGPLDITQLSFSDVIKYKIIVRNSIGLVKQDIIRVSNPTPKTDTPHV